jgi:general nucleoside transport system permease protein
MEAIIAGGLASVVTAGTLIILAGIGEIMAERTGVLNIGIEGIMAMGGALGVLVVNAYVPNVWVGLLAGALLGALFGAIFAVVVVIIKADQLLSGLALAFIGSGLSELIGDPVTSVPTLDRFPVIRIPILADIPFIGEAFFNHNLMVYIAFFILPIAIYLLLYRTRHGMAIRAVGHDPAAADASGINVTKMRFLYTTFGGMMFGIAGVYLTLALTRSWVPAIVAGRGWIVLTLVFFSRLSPITLVFGALLFGGATSLAYFVQVQGWAINSYYLGMLPYVVTLLLILFTNLKKKRTHPEEAGLNPVSLTSPYYRE